MLPHARDNRKLARDHMLQKQWLWLIVMYRIQYRRTNETRIRTPIYMYRYIDFFRDQLKLFERQVHIYMLTHKTRIIDIVFTIHAVLCVILCSVIRITFNVHASAILTCM